MVEIKRFGEFATFKYGKMPNKKKITDTGRYPVYSGYRYVGYYDEYNTEANQIIVIARGVGGTGDVKLTKEKCFLTNLSIAAHIDESVVLPHYLYYYFLTRNLRYLDSGSAQSQITISDLGKVEILIPSIEKQKNICDYLRILDSKIEMNMEINNNLEQQLSLIYHKYFDDEDACIELGTAIETTSGGTPSRKHFEYYTDADICWVKSKELLSTYIVDTEEHINNLAINKSSAKLLPAHSVLVAMYGATVGAYGIISKPMTCNQAVCVLLENEKYPYTYLYLLAKESQQVLVNMAVGSAQQNISQIIIKQLQIHSNTKKIQLFHEYALPIHKKIEAIQFENKALNDLRNSLLLKLMSGEIDVSSIDI